jgi:hypothetical protein
MSLGMNTVRGLLLTDTIHCKQSARGLCCFGDRRRFTTQTSGETGRARGVPHVESVQAIKTG